MRPRTCLSFAVPVAMALALVGAMITSDAAAQDYVQYEVERLKVLPGSTVDLGQHMLEHNQRFHADAPYTASAFYMMTGPYSGQYVWVMGPATFTQMDGRPADAAHTADWAERVMAHAELQTTEYWVRVDELSYTPESLGDGVRPVSLVRQFEVADDALFQKVQRQIMEATADAGSPRPRTMYRRRFLNADQKNWATVVTYRNWAELDETPTPFEERFRAHHGDAAWATFQEEFAEAVVSRQDSYRQLVTGN